DTSRSGCGTVTPLEALELARAKFPASDQADIDRELHELGIDPRSTEAIAIVTVYYGMTVVAKDSAPRMRDFVARLDGALGDTSAALTYPVGADAGRIPEIPRQTFLEEHADEICDLLDRFETLVASARAARDAIDGIVDGKIDVGLRRIYDALQARN